MSAFLTKVKTMKSHAVEPESIKHYLLGTLDVATQEQLEERLLDDAGLQEELSIAENEIVYAYLTGQLREQEIKQFEEHFLSTPERHRKLRFFASLIESIDSLPKPLSDAHLPPARRRFPPAFLRWENPFLRLSFAFGVLLLVLGGGWVVVRQRNETPTGNIASQLPAYTVTLSSGQQRDVGATQTTRVSIPDGVEAVGFRLPLATRDHTNYRAVLVADQNEEKFRTDALEVGTGAEAGMLRLGVPASALSPGDYQLKLYGLVPGQDDEEIDIYYFRVLR
jgi:hypothetical protein